MYLVEWRKKVGAKKITKMWHWYAKHVPGTVVIDDLVCTRKNYDKCMLLACWQRRATDSERASKSIFCDKTEKKVMSIDVRFGLDLPRNSFVPFRDKRTILVPLAEEAHFSQPNWQPTGRNFDFGWHPPLDRAGHSHICLCLILLVPHPCFFQFRYSQTFLK